MKIPFFKTTIGEEEKKAISDVIDSGWIVMGKKTKEFEERFAEYVGAKHAIFVDSGTSALMLGTKYLQLNGDYISSVPSLTFTSTAEVLVHNDLLFYFSDVSLEDFCLKDVTPESLPVHLTGNRAKDGALIYDSAHRIEKDDVKDSKAIWCYSFYATKNLSTVQGGMIATNDDETAKWLRAARDHGISKGTLERYTEKVPTYSIDFVGYRVKGDDLRAAIGLEQLKKLPWMTQRRNEIVARYNKNLGYSRVGNHLYPILVSDRQRFFESMELADIQCSVHFLPLHTMPGYKRYCRIYNPDMISGRDEESLRSPNLPNTEYLGQRLASIPLFPDMTDDQVDYISETILKTGLLIK